MIQIISAIAIIVVGSVSIGPVVDSSGLSEAMKTAISILIGIPLGLFALYFSSKISEWVGR